MPRCTGLAFLFLALFAIPCRADDPIPLPTPPMQGKPWTPPETRLSSILVNSVKELFDQGLADPRGCEYREVEIASGREYMPNAKIHAWVLPGGGGLRFAVLWNGRVSSVAKVGDAVDLHKDFSAATLGLGQFNLNWGIYDHSSSQEKTALPIKVAMLLRLGETDLAEGTMKDGGGWKPENGDPYLEMAREWLLSWYNCGTLAHSEGDDRLALQIFLALPPLEKAVSDAAVRRGFSKETAAIPEMRDLPLLIADHERRAKEPPHSLELDAGIADQHERVAALIRDLELVYATPVTYKSQTDVSIDAYVRALIQEGDAAAEPLIDCFENDQRLTRTQFIPGLRITQPQPWIPVCEPAYIALTAILKTSVTIPLPDGKTAHDLTMEDRKAMAAKFRDYWDKHKSISPPERWFSVLADDNATPREWFDAASYIVQPLNEQSIAPNPLQMRGEPLRNKTNPSVGDLMIKRFNQMLPRIDTKDQFDTAKSNNAITYADLSRLIFAFGDWDGKLRLGDLKKMEGDLNAKVPKYFGIGFVSSDSTNVTLYEKRVDLGDTTAMQEYTDWLLSIFPKHLPTDFRVDDYRVTTLRLMWEHPDDPLIQKTADKMFPVKGSAWHPESLHDHGTFCNLVRFPLIGLAAFREQMEQGLGDKTAMGYARIYSNGVDVQINGEEQNPDRLKDPHFDYRVCDRYAEALSQVTGFPDFHYDWPESRRDAAIAQCKTFLGQYGNRFQYRSGNFSLILPTLDHPATPDDVTQGRAIFSLSGEIRIYPMKLPMGANRPGWKGNPSTSNQISADGKVQQVTSYATGGTVWQAEEVKIDGKWERYYGFAGPHALEKVPASEMEFPSFGQRVTRQFDCFFELPDAKQMLLAAYNNYLIKTTEIPPLRVKFWAHNRNGLDQILPAQFIVPAGASKMLPPGLTLHLTYSEKIDPVAVRQAAPPSGQPPGLRPYDYAPWSEVPLKKDITIAGGKAPSPTLGAAANLELLQIDLRDYFEIAKPGTYRFDVVYQKDPDVPATREYVPPTAVTFTILPPAKPGQLQ